MIKKTFYYLTKRNPVSLKSQKFIDIAYLPKKNNKQINYLPVNIDNLKIYNFKKIFYEPKNKLNKNLVNFFINNYES